MKSIAWILLSWFVMTFTGQMAAGPFRTKAQCEEIAFDMSRNGLQVQLQCQERLP